MQNLLDSTANASYNFDNGRKQSTAIAGLLASEQHTHLLSSY